MHILLVILDFANQMYQLSIVITIGAHSKVIDVCCKDMREKLGSYIQDFEFIVVNNGAGKEALHRLKEFKLLFPHLTIIHLQHPCAEEEAMRLGLEYAQGDFIVMFADGAIYPVSEIRKLYDAITAYQSCMVVNGKGNAALSGKGMKAHLKGFVLKRFPGQYLEKGYFSALKIFRRSLFYATEKWENVHLSQYFRKHPNRIATISVEHAPVETMALHNFFILPVLPWTILILKGIIWLNISFLFIWSLIAWFSLTTETYFTFTGISLAMLILGYAGLLLTQKRRAVISAIK